MCVGRIKLLSALNQCERIPSIYSRSFLLYGENTLRSVDVDSSSSITASACLFINALRILNDSRDIPLMIRNCSIIIVGQKAYVKKKRHSGKERIQVAEEFYIAYHRDNIKYRA